MKRTLGYSGTIAGLVLSAWLCGIAASAGSVADYVPRLQRCVHAWQAELPAMRASAEEAARRAIVGGNLYAGGSQRSFILEAIGRSGGLMMIHACSAKTAFGAKDTILAASADTAPDSGLMALLRRARTAGANVVLFTRMDPSELPLQTGHLLVLPRKPFAKWPAESGIPIDSVGNVVGLWTWTAEFVSACVRHGKMPCVYQSYWRPGGRERDARFRGLRFHRQTAVKAADAVGLGSRYLRGLRLALDQVWRHDRAGFRRASALLRHCHDAGHAVRVVYMAHMFPSEMQVKSNPAWFTDAGSGSGEARAGDVTIALEYQEFPQTLVDRLTRNGSACILTCSEQPPATFAGDPLHVYLNPYWAVDDALLDLKGYDVKILPISGIMQSAIYWQLVELAR